jgi:CRISPR/Cas system endoribonuclease Cas6 (RAMP superfamily)
MTDGVLALAVRTALVAALPGVYVGVPQDDEAIPARAVLMELSSDVVVGSPLQRGTLTLAACSQADDYTVQENVEFAAQVDAAMRSLVVSSAAVQVYGVVAQTTENTREERHWRTNLSYTIGFGPT